MTNIERMRDIVKDYQKYANSKFYDYNKKASAIMEKYKPEVALVEIKSNI